MSSMRSDESNSSRSFRGGNGVSKYKLIPMALIVCLCMDDIVKQAAYLVQTTNGSSSSRSNSIYETTAANGGYQSAEGGGINVTKTRSLEDEERSPLSMLMEFGFEDSQVHSCPDIQTAKYDTSISKNAKRFKATPIHTWKLTKTTQSSSSSQQQRRLQAAATTLEFQIQECPPNYMASTFHIQASTANNIVTGTVGRRHKTEFGCGYYNATIELFPHQDVDSKAKQTCQKQTISADVPSVTVEVFWTSNFRNYQNQMHDRYTAEQIKKQNLSTAEIHDVLGKDRLDYLARHLDILPGFPVDLELPIHAFASSSEEDAGGRATTEELEGRASVAAPNSTNINSIINVLPNCSEVPINDWPPVGIAQADSSNKWQFVSSKCRYVEWNREDLYYWLSGLRIQYFADSHGTYESRAIAPLLCPEAGPGYKKFNSNRFECPWANNSFAYGHRFFRGILGYDGKDADGISGPMRHVKESACSQFLGLGLYNVTIITTPTWIFVYEIEEALFEYVQSMKNTLQMCRRLYPTEFENQIFLWQTPTASDVHVNSNRGAASEWRQNHNFRQEAYSKLLYQELNPYIDGIIPVFEWTLARNWKSRTKDGVHLGQDYYLAIFHLQVSAIISAMKSKGWNLPLFARDDPKARWFTSASG